LFKININNSQLAQNVQDNGNAFVPWKIYGGITYNKKYMKTI